MVMSIPAKNWKWKFCPELLTLSMPRNSANNRKVGSAKFFASLFDVGFLKPASATWGSLAAGVVLFFFFPFLGWIAKLIIIIITFVIGTILAEYIEQNTNLHDPHFIVIDEAVGMMITCFFLDQIWWHYVLAFVLFRIFDIAKLWPASFFDKRNGGFALMIDDVIMAFPALGVLHAILYFM